MGCHAQAITAERGRSKREGGGRRPRGRPWTTADLCCWPVWQVHYALAQAEAQLASFKPAQAALERAFALKDVRLKALDHPLLEKVWRDW